MRREDGPGGRGSGHYAEPRQYRIRQSRREARFRKEDGTKAADPLLEKLRSMKIAEIRALVDSASEEELAFVLDGIDMNESAAEYSMGHEGVGVGIAATMKSEKSEFLGHALLGRIMRRVASATEGRLDGCPYAVMSSAGSGSKGIAVIIPVAEAAKNWGAPGR